VSELTSFWCFLPQQSGSKILANMHTGNDHNVT
jgi:hypothetical protein